MKASIALNDRWRLNICKSTKIRQPHESSLRWYRASRRNPTRVRCFAVHRTVRIEPRNCHAGTDRRQFYALRWSLLNCPCEKTIYGRIIFLNGMAFAVIGSSPGRPLRCVLPSAESKFFDAAALFLALSDPLEDAKFSNVSLSSTHGWQIFNDMSSDPAKIWVYFVDVYFNVPVYV